MKGLFREYRFYKLGIIIFLLGFFLIAKLFPNKKQVSGFVYKPSYFIGEEITFSLIGENSKPSVVQISALTNNFKGEIICKPFKIDTQSNVLQNGVAGNQLNKINEFALETGIYLLNDTIPFVVNDTLKEAEIVIVYPYVNNLIKTSYNDKSVATEKLTSTHLWRSNFVDPVTIEISSFFKEIAKKYKVKYISDADLENIKYFKDAKLLIFYSDLMSVSLDMKNNLLQYIQGGGDVMIAADAFMNNLIFLDSNEKEVILNKRAKVKGIDSQDRYAASLWEIERKYIEEYIGLSYSSGGKPKLNNNYIFDANSKLFSGLEIDTLEVLSDKFIGVKAQLESSKLIYDKSVIHDVKVHAYLQTEFEGKETVSGIIEVTVYENGGKILSMGTDDWFAPKNFGEKLEFRIIADNAINYLLSD